MGTCFGPHGECLPWCRWAPVPRAHVTVAIAPTLCRSYIWNNNGDSAGLVNDKGEEVSSFEVTPPNVFIDALDLVADTVTIKNSGGMPQALKGWKLMSKTGDQVRTRAQSHHTSPACVAVGRCSNEMGVRVLMRRNTCLRVVRSARSRSTLSPTTPPLRRVPASRSGQARRPS